MSIKIPDKKQPSEKLLSLIRDAIDKGKEFLSIAEQVYKQGFDEGFARQEIDEIIRPIAKERGLTKHQIYYLTHRQERLEDVKARLQEQQESRKFATVGFNPTDPERAGEGITWVDIDDIKIIKNIIRQDPRLNSDFIASIARDGLLVPILVTKENRLILGYRRLMACKELHWQKIPVIVNEDIGEDEHEIMLAQFRDDHFFKPLEIMEMRSLQKKVEQETGRSFHVDYEKQARLLENYAFAHHEVMI
jgi:hypothetical protein